jgi:hypothetical protein
MLLLDYKVTLAEYDIYNSRFVGMEMCSWESGFYEFCPEPRVEL